MEVAPEEWSKAWIARQPSIRAPKVRNAALRDWPEF
jgi:hypothetical protein